MNIVISGRDAAALRLIETLLTGAQGVKVSSRLLNGSGQPGLSSLGPRPYLLILCCDDEHLEDLRALAALPQGERPPVILCGNLRSPEAARLAIRCGATDLLPAVPSRAELLDVVGRAVRTAQESASEQGSGSIVTVIGAAGGVGASFIAANLAHLAMQRDGQRSVLIDLDLQFAPLTAHLGVKPELGLLAALERVETLDRAALQGYVAHHRSGVALMANTGEGAEDVHQAPAEKFTQLLRLLSGQYDRIVVDASRMLDPLSAMAALEAQHVVMVLEQTIGNIHNAARLHSLLTRQLGVPRDRILTVINRYSRRSSIDPADIERTVGCSQVMLVGSEYELARDSLDAGTPVAERDRRSALSRALGEISARISGAEAPLSGGFLRRALPIFRKGES